MISFTEGPGFLVKAPGWSRIQCGRENPKSLSTCIVLHIASGTLSCGDDVTQTTETTSGFTDTNTPPPTSSIPTSGVDTDPTIDCELEEPETGPGAVGEWSEVVNWEVGNGGPDVVCDVPPCEEGPGFIAVHAVHLPTGKILLWDGLENGSGIPNEYLWSIDGNTLQYVPASYSRKGCAFDGRVDCETDIECEAYCEQYGKEGNGKCVNPDLSCVSGFCSVEATVTCTSASDCSSYCSGGGEEDPDCNIPGDFTCTPVEEKAELFCSGHTHGVDGIVTVAGGNVTGQLSAGGKREIAQFIDTEEWKRVEDVHFNAWRWYPSVIQLGDGRIFVLGGDDYNVVEIYDPDAPPSEAVIADQLFPPNTFGGVDEKLLYPFIFQIPGGFVFYAGAEGLNNPAYWGGQLFDTQKENRWLPNIKISSQIPGGSAVMYNYGKIMKSGGCSSSSNRCEATNGTEFIDFTNFNALKWQTACPMSAPRHFHTLTLLPDGTVLATGGNTEGNGTTVTYCGDGTGDARCNLDNGDLDCLVGRCDDIQGYEPCDIMAPDCVGGGECFIAGGTCAPYDNEFFATRHAEIWDPQTKKWTVLAAQQKPRMYHSTAILLPDGRVLSAGGGKRLPSLNSQQNAEFFSPPYLFQGPRPTVMSLPESITIGVPFEVTLGNVESSDIERVTLIRLGSVTHQFDMDQRFLELGHSVLTQDRLRVFAPTSVDEAVPGWYMLFVLDDGVPSVGEYIKVIPGE